MDKLAGNIFRPAILFPFFFHKPQAMAFKHDLLSLKVFQLYLKTLFLLSKKKYNCTTMRNVNECYK